MAFTRPSLLLLVCTPPMLQQADTPPSDGSSPQARARRAAVGFIFTQLPA